MPRVLVSPNILRRKPGPYRDILVQAGFEVVYPDDTADTFNPAVLARELVGIDAMLASTESSYVTGMVYGATGGQLMP